MGMEDCKQEQVCPLPLCLDKGTPCVAAVMGQEQNEPVWMSVDFSLTSSLEIDGDFWYNMRKSVSKPFGLAVKEAITAWETRT